MMKMQIIQPCVSRETYNYVVFLICRIQNPPTQRTGPFCSAGSKPRYLHLAYITKVSPLPPELRWTAISYVSSWAQPDQINIQPDLKGKMARGSLARCRWQRSVSGLPAATWTPVFCRCWIGKAPPEVSLNPAHPRDVLELVF